MKTLKIYLDEHNEKSEVGYGLVNLGIWFLADDVVLMIIVTASFNKCFFVKLFLSIILKSNYSVEMNNKSNAFFLSLKNHFNFLK